jgi:hypothetical protein
VSGFHHAAATHLEGIMVLSEIKAFGKPDEVREFPMGRLELVTVDNRVIGRATLEPGWKWSTSVKPVANTHSCQAAHFQYQASGRLMVQMDDGSMFESKAGDISNIPPGHDAWVVGDEPVVLIDFQGMKDYALTLK